MSANVRQSPYSMKNHNLRAGAIAFMELEAQGAERSGSLTCGLHWMLTKHARNGMLSLIKFERQQEM